MGYLGSKGVSLVTLKNQYKGRRFGELVLHHAKVQSIDQISESLIGLKQNLHPILKVSTLEFLDTITFAFAKTKAFWKTDCGEALTLYTNSTISEARKKGLELDDDYAFDTFNLIVLTLAHKSLMEPEFKRFIKRAIRKYWLF